MPKYTVRKGRRYWAEIVLGFFERWAGNDTVAAELAKVGFIEVEVKGHGARREASALWPLEDATADIPAQVSRIVDLSERDGGRTEIA